MDIRVVLEVARSLKKAHTEHHSVAVTMAQATDEQGIALSAELQAVFPPRALLIGRIQSLWWGELSAVDPVMFRDASGNFTTVGPIHEGCGYLYIPFGSAKHRGPGLYNLDLTVELPGAGGTSAALARSTYKLALPPPRSWRKTEYLWPLIGICMAVIRADDEVVTGEVRGLKDFMVSTFHLRSEDMEGLRAAMKNTAYGELADLVACVERRMPLLGAEDLMRLLFHVARIDGPVNPREHRVLERIADHVELSRALWAELLAIPSGASTLRTSSPR